MAAFLRAIRISVASNFMTGIVLPTREAYLPLRLASRSPTRSKVFPLFLVPVACISLDAYLCAVSAQMAVGSLDLTDGSTEWTLAA